MDIGSKVIESMNRLCRQEDNLLLCVSGGIDSIVLFDILQKGGWNFSVAHCNFSLRGDESDGDEHFVRDLCKKYDKKCHIIKFDTNAYAKVHKTNTQIAARKLRYGYFSMLKKEYSYDYIVVAHHLDDSIETFFINLLRGTGLKGLSGISESINGGVIRPMLGITRLQISEYAKKNGLMHREDSTNSQDHYLRNRIRHHIIPLLTDLSANFRETMLDNLQRLTETELFVEQYTEKIKEDISSEDGMVLDIKSIKESSHFHLLLFRFLHPHGFGSSVISQLETAIRKGETSKWFMGESKRILLENNKISILNLESERSIETIIELNSDSIEISDISEVDDYRKASEDIAYLDIANIAFPLTLRKWKAGDRFHPLGMKGSKTIGDFLTDKKVSLAHRDKIKVITDSANNIIWVIGIQIDDRYKITGTTKTIVKLSATKLNQNDI